MKRKLNLFHFKVNNLCTHKLMHILYGRNYKYTSDMIHIFEIMSKFMRGFVFFSPTKWVLSSAVCSDSKFVYL